MKNKKLKRAIATLFLSMTLATLCWGVMAAAQGAPPAAPPIVPGAPAVVSGGIMGWVTSHGGFQAATVLLVYCLNVALSSIRTIAYKLDGLDLTAEVPPDYKGLTLLNKIALVVGNVTDFLTGNTQHK